jgi:hypothetical protein
VPTTSRRPWLTWREAEELDVVEPGDTTDVGTGVLDPSAARGLLGSGDRMVPQ